MALSTEFLREHADAHPDERRDDSPEEEPTLAWKSPDGSQSQAGAPGGPHARHVADEFAVARDSVRPREVEAAQPGVNRASPAAGEDIDSRAWRLEQQRVGEAGAARLGLVELRPLGLEFSNDLVMPVGGGLGGAQRIAARMGGFVEERRIVGAARLPVEGRKSGACKRDRGFDAVRRIDARDNDPPKRALSAPQRRDRPLEAAEREGLAGPARTQDRRQEGRLRLGRRAELGERLNHFGNAKRVGPLCRVGEEDWLGGRDRRRRGGRHGGGRGTGGRNGFRRLVHRSRGLRESGQRRRRLFARAAAEKTNFRCVADVGQRNSPQTNRDLCAL